MGDESINRPAPKATTSQQRLQQKLMSEALQQVEIKKERAKAKANANKPNPTINKLEVLTRKENKTAEMEHKLARGELSDVPIPDTPEHFKKDDRSTQQKFFENISAQQQ